MEVFNFFYQWWAQYSESIYALVEFVLTGVAMSF